MHSIVDPILRYLAQPTDYALLINGKWGTGKTFHVRNRIEPYISKAKTVKHEKDKSYLPVYVSLFGVSSIGEIETRILTESYSVIQPFIGTQVLNLIKSAGKEWLNSKGLSEIGNYLKELGVKKVPSSKYDEIALIIDDIERKGDGLSLQEFSGFINNLCDRRGTKVILITNETGFSQADIEGLKIVKEKVVGVQVDFVPDFSRSFDEIVQASTKDQPAYRELLASNYLMFAQYIKGAGDNLRTLKYVFENFRSIFIEIQNYRNDFPDKKDLIRVLDEEISTFLKFAFVIAIEFRSGAISYTKRNDLGNNQYAKRILWENTNAKEKNEPLYIDVFQHKYYPEGRLNFFGSIYSQITGGPAFQIKDFLKEIEYNYNVTDAPTPRHYEVLQILNSRRIYTCSDEQHGLLVRELYDYAIDGLFKLEDYLVIFDVLTRYGNVTDYDISEVVKSLKEGIDKSVSQKHHDVRLERRAPPSSPKYPEAIGELNNYVMMNRLSFKKEEESKNYHEIKSALLYRPSDLERAVGNYRASESFERRAFFSRDLFAEFIPAFEKYSNAMINDLLEFFGVRYYNMHFNVVFADEEPFFKQFRHYLEEQIKDANPALSIGLKEELRDQIINIMASDIG